MKNLKCPFYVIFFLIILGACSSDDAIQPVSERKIYPHFAVISDIHVGRPDSKDKIINTLKNILNRSGQLDAIFVVGDLTDNAKESQYNGLIQLFDSHVPKSIPVYYMLGNHDQVWSDGDPEALYLNKLQQPLNQYTDIKGFPFITVSVRNVNPYYYYSQSEIDFLSASLENASVRYPDKPIFVFAHVGVSNTVYGTGSNEGWGTDTFASILRKYPQVVIFSGHSHFPIGDPRSIHQAIFTSVNLGSVTYSEIESGFTEGEHPPGNELVTEAIIATVNDNFDIELLRLDTYRNEKILPKWILKAPHNGTMFTYANRNGGNAPAFNANDKPTISNITANSCTISFPQAIDNDVVHHYIVEILDSNGQIYKNMTFFSQFYLNSDMPNSLSPTISGLVPRAKYTIQVTAVDSYYNKSGKITSAEFTTSN